MKLFRKLKKEPIIRQAPDGKRLYAIGDVHGCKDQLMVLMDKINQDIANKPPKTSIIVFLGDLIDRGPDSAGVVEFVKNFSEKWPSCYTLMGNHEDIFLESYNGNTEALDRWLNYGGIRTLESYGLDPFLLNSKDLDQIHFSMRKKIPKTHIKFLSACLDSIEFGDYFLVHAGVNPALPLSEQTRDIVLWMREPFLSHSKPLEKMIVHGHTIEPEVTRHTHRISVDTGAYDGGPLSAICLEGDSYEVLECHPNEVTS